MTQTLTVLSGDVVGSTQLSGTDQRRVFEALPACRRAIVQRFHCELE